MFTEDELRQLASHASTLQDRCSGKYTFSKSDESIEKAKKRLSKWRKISSDDDSQKFNELLDYLKINNSDVLTLLGDAELSPSENLPDWVNVFTWVFQSILDDQYHYLEPITNRRLMPIPFEEIFTSVANEAYKRIDAQYINYFGNTAREDLQQYLVKRISDICTPCLYDEFCLHRTFALNLVGSISSIPNNRPESTQLYEQFVMEMKGGKLKQFFQLRPVLAHLVSMIVHQWIQFTNSFSARLINDISTLEKIFNSGKPIGKLKFVHLGLSDPHNGGNTVCKLTFTNGKTIGYKPKNLHVDKIWAELLSWLDSKSSPMVTAPYQSIVFDGYGWSEWVTTSGSDEEKFECFYENSGALLCLLHMLQTTDIHYENVIASKSCLIPVDLETVFHPRPTIQSDSTSEQIATWLLQSSVASTGFLPFSFTLKNGQYIDIGGLNYEFASRAKKTWVSNINTDQMSIDTHEGKLTNSLSDGIQPATQNSIRYGYEKMFKFILKNRASLLFNDSPLREFSGKRIRIVRRSTIEYNHKLNQSLQRTCLSNGIDRSIKLFSAPITDRLCSDSEISFKVDHAERSMLEQLDIPYFWTKTDSRNLYSSNGLLASDYLLSLIHI